MGDRSTNEGRMWDDCDLAGVDVEKVDKGVVSTFLLVGDVESTSSDNLFRLWLNELMAGVKT